MLSAPARRAPRAARLTLWSAVAALPLALATGCSHAPAHQGARAAAPTASATAPSAKPSPTARFAALPDPCGAISRSTVTAVVPGAAPAAGTEVGSGQPDERGGCSWHGLNGYQYRYLDTAFQRFDVLTGAPSADDQAAGAFRTAVRGTTAGAATDRATATTADLPGVGDQARLVTWDATRDHVLYRNVSVIACLANAVVSVDYTGAGLQGDRRPDPTALRSAAERVAKEALAALG